MSKGYRQWLPLDLLEQAVQQARVFAGLLHEAWTEYERDNARYLATAMVYYAIVSLVPLLLLLLSSLGLLLRFSQFAVDVQQQVLSTVEASFGGPLRELIEQLLDTLQQESIIGTIIGLVGMVLAASALFRHLRLAFRAIWNYAPTLVSGPMRVVVRATLLEQIAAFMIMLLGGGALLAALLVLAVAQWLNSLLSSLPRFSYATGWMLTTLSPFALGLLTFTLLFIYLPPTPLDLRDIWLAALLCTATWWATGVLLTLYGQFFDANRSAYGALGALFVVMMWMNILSQTLFFGAELCKVIATKRGSVGSRGTP